MRLKNVFFENQLKNKKNYDKIYKLLKSISGCLQFSTISKNGEKIEVSKIKKKAVKKRIRKLGEVLFLNRYFYKINIDINKNIRLQEKAGMLMQEIFLQYVNKYIKIKERDLKLNIGYNEEMKINLIKEEFSKNLKEIEEKYSVKSSELYMSFETMIKITEDIY